MIGDTSNRSHELIKIGDKTLPKESQIQRVKYLNDIELLEKSIVNATMKQEDGEYIKKNIHFSFIMP